MRIVALDTTAEKASLRCGLGVAEVRAICPEVDVVPVDAAADRALLESLADWCGRYTPLVALDRTDGLLLDISGCTHLFGGERALLDDVLMRLFHLGIEARGAVSSTAGLSWAVSRYREGTGAVITEEEGTRILAMMPMAALRLGEDIVAALSRVGLKRVGDIIAAPRAPITRRFGPEPLLRLDQALGHAGEALSPRLPVPEISSERRLAEPVTGEDDILSLVLRLADIVKTNLEEKGSGGRLFELALFRVDGRVFRIEAGTSAPLRDPQRIGALFRERMSRAQDELDAGFGFEIVRLSVLRKEKFETVQADMAGSGTVEHPLSAFVDRVTARFGTGSLRMPAFAESHLPERAVSLEKFENTGHMQRQGKASAVAPVARLLPAARPLRLLSHPEPVEATAEVPEGAPMSFRWRRALHRTVRAEGPERIAAEWWIHGEAAPTRDYFRVEDDAGRRYWLYREGFYEQGADKPRWFLHGVFA